MKLSLKQTVIKQTVTAIAFSTCAVSGALAQTVLFSENFNSYYNGIQNALQPGTGLQLSYGGSVPNWTKYGGNSVHAVNFGSNFAVTFINDNTLTLNAGIAANAAGQQYAVSFDAGPAVYFALNQATGAGDGLVVSVLRGDSSVLAQSTILPGAWVPGPNAQALHAYSFNYIGDGNGDVRLRIASLRYGLFGGAIDNMQVASIPEPSTYMMMGIGLLALVGVRRSRMTKSATCKPN